MDKLEGKTVIKSGINVYGTYITYFI